MTFGWNEKLNHKFKPLLLSNCLFKVPNLHIHRYSFRLSHGSSLFAILLSDAWDKIWNLIWPILCLVSWQCLIIGLELCARFSYTFNFIIVYIL